MSKIFYTTTKLLGLLVLFMTAALCLDAQEKVSVRMQVPAEGYEFSNTLSSGTIPFKLTDNLIVIRVELNAKMLNLVLDSDMPMEGALLFCSAKVDSTNLNFSVKMPVGGVGGDAILFPPPRKQVSG